MTDKITLTRNLIGMEDLAVGTGTVNQTRGDTVTPITQVNAAVFPYDSTQTLEEKIESLVTNHYVNEDDVPVYVATPASATDLDLPSVIWVKNVSASVAEVYYYDVLLFSYHPTSGDLLLSASSFGTAKAEIEADYTAADAVVLATSTALLDAYIAAQVIVQAAMADEWAAADTAGLASLSLGSASKLDVGTNPLEVVQLTDLAKLPALDGSLLTNLAAATLPSGASLSEEFEESTATTSFSSLIARAGSAPAATEGTELLTKTITPTAIGNKIAIRFRGSAHPSATGVRAAALLFVDGTFVRGEYSGASNGGPLYPAELCVEHVYTATALDPVVISVRVGPTIVAGSITFNDNSWGSTGKGASMTVREIKA